MEILLLVILLGLLWTWREESHKPQEMYIRELSSQGEEIVLPKNKRNFTQNLKYLEAFLFWHLNWLGHAKMCLKNQLLEKEYTT